MTYTQSIRFKIMILVVIPVLFVAFSFIAISIFTQNRLVDADNTTAVEQNISAIMEDYKKSTLAYAEIAVQDISTELAEAIIAATADPTGEKSQEAKDKIIKLVKPSFTYMECDGMTFTDNEGNALARITNPAKFGDNIKSSHAIADAMQGKSVSYAYPTLNNGFSITAGVPIKYQGAQIGTLFLSKRLDKATTLGIIKNKSDCEIVIYQGDTLVLSSFENDNYKTDDKLSPEIWESVSRGEIVTEDSKVEGKGVLLSYLPIIGKDNAVVGTLLAINYDTDTSWVGVMWTIVFAVYLAILYPIISLNIVNFVKPIRKLRDEASVLATGDVSLYIEHNRTDELGQLQESMISLLKAMNQESAAIEKLAERDFSNDYPLISEKDVVGKSLETLLRCINQAFAEIQKASKEIFSGAGQIASGASNLAQSSTEQAATIEELAASIEGISKNIDGNTDMARNAAVLANTIKQNAEKGSSQMSEMTKAVEEINRASGDISKVIKVIDDIAFQTNILALNAAVEAARAGEAGKGFAVVADEVRNLASKSAEAAKNTTELIANSISKAELGAKIAAETAVSLAEIVLGINESADIVNRIAESSASQNLAISEVNSAIETVANVVQKNSATSEENAAVSSVLENQANILLENVAKFKLKTGE